MAINSLSTGFRPGVCTFSTRPTAPYEGQVIYETDTDLSYVWGGAAWQQVSGGTAVGNSGLVFVKSQTIGSAVSSVTVSDAFSATYDNYKITVNGGTCSSSDQNFGLKIGAAVTGYYYAVTGATYLGVSSILALSNGNDFNRAGSIHTDGLYMNVDLQNPFLTKRTFATGSTIFNASSRFGAGYLDTTTSYTDFTLTPGAGTLTGGTITVYGYRK